MTLIQQLTWARAYVLGVAFAFGVVLPRAGGAETLADALVAAYNNSGLLEQNEAVLRAADEDVAIAASTLKPVLNWTSELNQRFGTAGVASQNFASDLDTLTISIGLIGELLLYDAGASRFRVEAAKETVLATRGSLVDVEQNVLLRAVSAYMGVIAAREFVALRKNNRRLLTEELRATEDRFEVGEVTRTDVALAEAQLAEARSGLAEAEGNYTRAVEEFRNAVGRAPGNLTTPPSLPKIGRGVDSAKALAVRQHPLMVAAQHRVSATELLLKAVKADLQPEINLTGQYGYTETFDSSDYNHSGSVGISASQTIYGGGRLTSQVRQNMAQRDQQRANLYVVTKDVQQDVGNAYANLDAAQAVLDASVRQIRAARIAFNGVREEATLGARTTLDVLDAEQSLLDAENAQVAARANLYVAAYSVLASIGELTAQNLRLPVQTYDPTAYYNLVKDGPTKLSKQGRQLDRVLRALQKQ